MVGYEFRRLELTIAEFGVGVQMPPPLDHATVDLVGLLFDLPAKIGRHGSACQERAEKKRGQRRESHHSHGSSPGQSVWVSGAQVLRPRRSENSGSNRRTRQHSFVESRLIRT
jgi:hypothetical protein